MARPGLVVSHSCTASSKTGTCPHPTPPHPPPAVYWTQGLLGLSRLAVFTFFKADLALAPATVGFLTSLSYAPWVRLAGGWGGG